MSDALKVHDAEYDSDSWATPWSIYKQYDFEFHFTLDVCASEWNHKHPNYFDKARNGLEQNWAPNVCWMNPPYSEIPLWITKAYAEAHRGATVVCLVPARTDSAWWHDWVIPFADEVRFIRGRIQFEPPPGRGKPSSPAFGSAAVIFHPKPSY